MTTAYPHIDAYHEELRRLIQYGGSDNESSIRRAFENCLDSYCRNHPERLALVAELESGNNNWPDGTVKDTLRLARGYWEAKDTRDNLDREIQNKLNQGYPRDNIIFEDSRVAVLFQNGAEAMRVNMAESSNLHHLIARFLDYELPEIQSFRKAQGQFSTDLPAVLDSLRATIDDAEAANEEYRVKAAEFLKHCHSTIGNDISEGDVREMLLQHILTKDIFLRVFAEDQFHSENTIAHELNALEATFFTGNVRRASIDRLRSYYGAIGRAADTVSDFQEKQTFLKGIYEDFYKAYNPKAADRLGIVYTPNEIVDFMIRGTDYLLKTHFGRSLADNNVEILDPATGTGTFVTSLINYLPHERLEYKYHNEIHANEVAILPYYIANLNIEYTYKERMGKYSRFPGLAFVDTLDNMEWREQSAEGQAVTHQPNLTIGGLSDDNWYRVQEQNERKISVIIGNPPYNANQRNDNDLNPNRAYPAIDRRIRDTYVKESSAQKSKQYDMYKRFIRWAADRLDDEGIIAFVTNSAFLHSHQDDGFRKLLPHEFCEVWAIDMTGNARPSGEQRRREGGNVFDDKIRVGVAIYFFVRKSERRPFRIQYTKVADYTKASDKLKFVKGLDLATSVFEEIEPDQKANWLNKSDSNFDSLMSVAGRETKNAKNQASERAVFRLYTTGVVTARDEWVYDFDRRHLEGKSSYFVARYNIVANGTDKSLDMSIKWSEALRNHLKSSHRIDYAKSTPIVAAFRPYVAKHFFPAREMSDRLTANHYEMFGDDLLNDNQLICFQQVASSGPFRAIATNRLPDFHLTGDTQCLPLYRYREDGTRVSNITQWGLRQFRDHYGDQAITAEQIFAYTYAVLHDPVYREKYAIDLTRDFPRLPFQDDFSKWVEFGQELLELHIGFESEEPHPLKRVDKALTGRGMGSQPKVLLRADKEHGIIRLDERTSLENVPKGVWDYRLGNRSAVEWILDQYKEKTPRDPTIREQFNTYKFADHKEKGIDLLKRVTTVSLRTNGIVDSLAKLSNLADDS